MLPSDTPRSCKYKAVAARNKVSATSFFTLTSKLLKKIGTADCQLLQQLIAPAEQAEDALYDCILALVVAKDGGGVGGRGMPWRWEEGEGCVCVGGGGAYG